MKITALGIIRTMVLQKLLKIFDMVYSLPNIILHILIYHPVLFSAVLEKISPMTVLSCRYQNWLVNFKTMLRAQPWLGKFSGTRRNAATKLTCDILDYIAYYQRLKRFALAFG